MNWNETWKKLQKELGRDPTNAEVAEAMLNEYFDKD